MMQDHKEPIIKEKRTHWPVLCLGLLLLLIFLTVLFVFQVRETEYAVIRRLGRPLRDDQTVRVYGPGLHFKWPFIDRVWRHDRRLLPYDLTRGQVEQSTTRDEYMAVVSTFVFWRVGDPLLFLSSFNTTAEAEAKIDELTRHSRHSVLAEHRLEELVNVDRESVRIDLIERKMLEGVRDIAMREYGIEVVHLGIRHFGFPEQVTTAVFSRMVEERNKLVEAYRTRGTEEAEKIKTNADLEARRLIAEAEAEATRIRGRGDRQAAEQYAIFRENPELAAFLRKLEALRRTLSEKTTLVVDTGTPPYDLLREGALDLQMPSDLRQVAEPTREQTTDETEENQ